MFEQFFLHIFSKRVFKIPKSSTLANFEKQCKYIFCAANVPTLVGSMSRPLVCQLACQNHGVHSWDEPACTASPCQIYITV